MINPQHKTEFTHRHRLIAKIYRHYEPWLSSIQMSAYNIPPTFVLNELISDIDKHSIFPGNTEIPINWTILTQLFTAFRLILDKGYTNINYERFSKDFLNHSKLKYNILLKAAHWNSAQGVLILSTTTHLPWCRDIRYHHFNVLYYFECFLCNTIQYTVYTTFYVNKKVVKNLA